jgi:hypothetical protein
MSEQWLLVKRGLYYRPNDCGYTGIRDYAGRYSEEEARARMSPGIAMIRLDSAPEFSEACFEDLARKHLADQRDALRAAVAPFLRYYDDIRFNLRKQPRPTDAAIEECGERVACVTWEEFYALRKAFTNGPSPQT